MAAMTRTSSATTPLAAMTRTSKGEADAALDAWLDEIAIAA
jgi:hypothetical protein